MILQSYFSEEMSIIICLPQMFYICSGKVIWGQYIVCLCSKSKRNISTWRTYKSKGHGYGDKIEENMCPEPWFEIVTLAVGVTEQVIHASLWLGTSQR